MAAPLIDEPVAALKLENGTVLHDAVAKGFLSSSVMVRHRDGAQSVPYEQFPEEYRGVLLEKRPAKTVAATPRPVPTPKAKAPGAKEAAPSQPMLRLVSSSVRAEFATVEIYNDSNQPAVVQPEYLAVQLSDGSSLAGRQFVQTSEDGKITGTLNRVRTLTPRETATLALAFARIPEGKTAVRVAWRR